MSPGERRWVWWLLLLGGVAAGGIAIGLGVEWIPIGERAKEGWRLLLTGEPTGLRDWLLDFGIWAPIASALLQILSSLIPFLPGFVLSIANAMLYGALLGGLLTFSTSLLAAAICFGIARVAGRSAVERIVPPLALARVNQFVDHNGGWAVFWGRLLPFINPDVVSYAAGLTRLRWIRFLIPMAAGALPATIFYSVLGAAALEAAPSAILLVSAATLLPLLVLWVLRRRIFGGGGGNDGGASEGGEGSDEGSGSE